MPKTLVLESSALLAFVNRQLKRVCKGSQPVTEVCSVERLRGFGALSHGKAAVVARKTIAGGLGVFWAFGCLRAAGVGLI